MDRGIFEAGSAVLADGSKERIISQTGDSKGIGLILQAGDAYFKYK